MTAVNTCGFWVFSVNQVQSCILCTALSCLVSSETLLLTAGDETIWPKWTLRWEVCRGPFLGGANLSSSELITFGNSNCVSTQGPTPHNGMNSSLFKFSFGKRSGFPGIVWRQTPRLCAWSQLSSVAWVLSELVHDRVVRGQVTSCDRLLFLP